MVPLHCLLHRVDQLLATDALLVLAATRVPQLDAGFVGEVLDGADEVRVLDLLDELEHVAGCGTPEALVAAHVLSNVERSALLRMERAKADPVLALFAEGDVALDDIDDGHRSADPLDVLVHDRHGARLPEPPTATRWWISARRRVAAAASVPWARSGRCHRRPRPRHRNAATRRLQSRARHRSPTARSSRRSPPTGG